jgi:hypothetical protein
LLLRRRDSREGRRVSQKRSIAGVLLGMKLTTVATQRVARR